MFLATRQASDDRSPWGDFWFEPVSVRSMAGMRVSADAAMRLSAVYACVRVLAETFAVLPFCLYRERADGGKERVRDHWLYRLFARQPNRWQNAFEWREMCMGHLALRGNAYNRIVANARGEIEELVPLHPDRMRVELLDSGAYRYRLRNRDGSEEVLPAGEVWHLRGLSSDGIVGLSPIELARETIGMGLAAQEYGSRFFANDARPGGGWIEFPGQFKDTAARQTFRETWQAAQGGANKGKVAVLELGMKYHEIGVVPKDAQFLEARQFQVTEIARVFRIPPHMIADLTRSTNNNIEHQALEFVTHTMTPWAERWEAAIESALLLDDEALEVEFDFANLLRGDAAARSSYYASGIVNGWLTRNEARISENLEPLDGLDEPLMPVNLMEVDDAEAAESAAEEATEADNNVAPRAPGGTPDDTGAQRLAALVRANAERLARRAAGALAKQPIENVFDADFADVVAKALAVPLPAAQAWCAGMQLAAVHTESGIAEALVALGEHE